MKSLYFYAIQYFQKKKSKEDVDKQPSFKGQLTLIG